MADERHQGLLRDTAGGSPPPRPTRWSGTTRRTRRGRCGPGPTRAAPGTSTPTAPPPTGRGSWPGSTPRPRAVFKEARAANARGGELDAYRFDALVRIAESGRRRAEPRPRPHLFVNVDADKLTGGNEAAGRCEIKGVGPVPVETARELMGDALLTILVKKGVDVTTIAHDGSKTMPTWCDARCWPVIPECVVDVCSAPTTEVHHSQDDQTAGSTPPTTASASAAGATTSSTTTTTPSNPTATAPTTSAHHPSEPAREEECEEALAVRPWVRGRGVVGLRRRGVGRSRRRGVGRSRRRGVGGSRRRRVGGRRVRHGRTRRLTAARARPTPAELTRILGHRDRHIRRGALTPLFVTFSVV